MKNVNSFFSENNTVRELSEGDLKQIFDYVKVIDAFSITSNQSIYVIDYEKKGFDYVSTNPLFLNGHTPTEVLEMGYEFYFKYVPDKELDLLLKINTIGFEFYDKVPEAERKLYSIAYDFHIKTQDEKLILINQKLTPMFMTEKGKLWKALSIVSLSTNQNVGNITVSKSGENKTRVYDLDNNVWTEQFKTELSEREVEILQLSMRGHSISEVGERLFISSDTVKFHRRKIYEKLEVNNISEAILIANNLQLI